MRAEVIGYCQAKGWEYSADPGSQWIRLKRCPVCGKTARKPFAIHAEEGTARCFHGDCGWSGGLTLLKRHFGDLVSGTGGPIIRSGGSSRKLEYVKPPKGLAEEFAANLRSNEDWVQSFLDYRKLKIETIDYFNIGLDTNGRGISYPYYDNGELVAIKFKKRKGNDKVCMRWVPIDNKGKPVKGKTTRPTLFNVQNLKGNERAYVTEGEDDCMVLHQLGYKNVVSIPNGSSAISGPWIDPLESFHDVVICFDADDAGRRAAIEFSEQLGKYKCRIASLPDAIRIGGKWGDAEAKDATDFIRAGNEDLLRKAIDAAPVTRHDKVTSLSDHIAEFREKFLYGSRSPGRTTGFPSLDAIVGGRRPTELTMLSGVTGSGKTTFCINMILKSLIEGEGVLYGSFEIPVQEVMERIAQMVTGKHYCSEGTAIANPMELEDLDRVCEIFDSLPLYFVNQFGQMSTADFIDCMDYAKRRLGVNNVFLDHIHYMLQARRQQDQTVELEIAMKELKLATKNMEVWLCVVAHPRKPDGKNDEIGLYDLKGSSALAQDADNFWVVKRDRINTSLDSNMGAAQIDILKNRKLGTEGTVNLGFNVKSQIFVDPLGDEVDSTIFEEESTEEDNELVDDDEFMPLQ